ncbi:MFS transporter [Rhizobium sp. S152]|uniref:MFS transporter n=1 Tax=Rhizobium sp. S152 TaxID=3055038 RepID=UPI0025A9AF4C|nr:MFS transporter [Rhizobium sp. S152]MDM9628471.1 MFS transporter [Rhizobium sp. S152]
MSTFVIGTAEFVVMGILPDVAADLSISIPKAGWLITAYALGIAFGGLLFSLIASKLKRKVALVSLMAFFAAANAICAWAPGYETLMVARVLAASGQGAFFGIGAVMAASLVPANRQASAVAMMFTGLTLANVLGVPLGTAVGHWLGWRAPFIAITVLSVVGMIGLAFALPSSHGEEKVDVRSEVIALADRRIWISLASTVLFTMAIFPVFTYVAPLLQNVSGLSSDWIAITLLVVGLGMTLGSYVGGRLSDWSLQRALVGIPVAIAVASLALRWTTPFFLPGEINWFVWGAVTFAAIPTLQVSVMRFGSGAPNLVSTLNIGAFNIGIALGARVGGAALENGYQLLDIPVVAAAIALLALVGVLASTALLRTSPKSGPVTA